MTVSLVLDASQRSVVDVPAHRSLRVLGGPGSGKTTALIERVAALAAQPGWSPDNVLVLTGNRLAATHLRDVLALRIGQTTSGPLARTVASVAFHVVQAHLGRPVTLLTGAEHDSLLAELLAGECADGTDDYWPMHLGRELRALRGFRTELREFIMRTEEYGISSDDLRALARRAERPEWAAVAQFLDRALVPQSRAFPDQFDAAQLASFAARIVADGAALGGLEHVRAILVDDAQDTTESGIALLRAWARRGVPISVFGDPDVASSGFRGGQADLMSAFGAELGIAEPVELVLDQRHRGAEPIRQAYARVVQAIGTRAVQGHREQLPSAALPESGPNWNRVVSPSATTEARAIASELRRRHLLDGVPWSELAVLSRSTRIAQALERDLARMGVPTRRNVTRQLLRDDDGARWLLDAARFVYRMLEGTGEPSERSSDLERLLASPLAALSVIELRQLRLLLRESGVTLLDAVRRPLSLELLDRPVAKRAAEACSTLAAALRAARDGTVEDVLWELWIGSVAQRNWSTEARGRGSVAEHANVALDAVVAVFAAAKRFVERRPRDHGSVFIAEQFELSLPEDIVLGERSRETVAIGTPAQFVGRSFDTVVIATLNDGVWPNLRPRFSLLHADELIARHRGDAFETDIADERAVVRSDEYRLFALALSRARNRAVLSAHIGEDAAPSVLFGDASTIEPGRVEPTRLRDLAGQLRRRLVRAVERGDDVSPTAAALRRLAEAGVPGADPSDWYGLREWSTREPLERLDDPDTQIRVSPSNLEKIEKSSLAWFIDRFAPAPPSDAQAIGTIVHAALETLGSRADVSVEDYVAEVADPIAALSLPAEWMRTQRDRQVRRMLERLCQYLESSRSAGHEFLAAEAPFVLEYGPVVVSGVIDRVERTPDGAVYVVDLKTGRTAVTQAEGQDSAQLQCYQLAIREGAIEGIDAAEAGGAALLYVQTSAQSPTIRDQNPLDSDGAEAVRQRIRAAAERMAAAEFTDFDEVSDRGPTGARRYRIQMIPGVSA